MEIHCGYIRDTLGIHCGYIGDKFWKNWGLICDKLEIQLFLAQILKPLPVLVVVCAHELSLKIKTINKLI